LRKIILLSFLFLSAAGFSERQVVVEQNQLVVDGEKQPQLFGAEVQYFRMRGGFAANQPREKVLALWNKALDKVVEAKMNAISFYIPWDFHEYAEGQFDFTGTVDEDGDGRPDYPSRDILTFFRLIKEHGIQHVMVRPGPYINAEWGFLGFGAIPEWFHNKYPDSHMRSSWGPKTKLYDYLNPDLLAKTKIWFSTLYSQVLKDKMGPGQPIEFLQLDNETNYQWQSIYNNDYGPRALSGYRKFLKTRYQGDLTKLNQIHRRSWSDWNSIQAPKQFGQNLEEDQDWYRYADESIHTYLVQIRRMWEDLGVKEPQVLFTLAESYNAADQGLLPNYLFRNDRGNTGLMTVNLYPKTFERDDHPLLNNPFKADLDVKAASSANAAYWGSLQEWAMGPEIQAGWWRGIDVTTKARQQTYLTVIGHGLKAFFVYYFNEGDNFGSHWAYNRAQKLYSELRKQENIPDTCPPKDLSNAFWGELQARMDRGEMIGFDTRSLVQSDVRESEKLYFDAPLDSDLNPREHYFGLKEIGEKLIAPYQDFLARSLEVQDEVALVKDDAAHVPNPHGIKHTFVNAEWSAGLLGYLMNANINPHILIGEISCEEAFQQKLLVHIDTGVNAERTLTFLKNSFVSGNSIVNFLADQVALRLGYPTGIMLPTSSNSRQTLVFGNNKMTAAATPLFTYDQNEIEKAGCESILWTEDQKPVGYRCRQLDGNFFVQIGALLFDDFNSSDYGLMTDVFQRKIFLQEILDKALVAPRLKLSDNADRTVAFGRKDPDKKILWITVKTGSQKHQDLTLKIKASLLPSFALGSRYRIKNLLGGREVQRLKASDLVNTGFKVHLNAEDSTVYVVERID